MMQAHAPNAQSDRIQVCTGDTKTADFPNQTCLKGAARTQRGISLVIALMVLAVLTIAGLSVASMSRTELRIAQNERYSLESFDAAESGLSRIIRSPTERQAEIDPFTHGTDPVASERVRTFNSPNSDWSSEVRVKPLGPPMPCPISDVASAGTDKCVFYEITSTSDGPGRGGNRSVTGSAYVKVTDGDISTFYTAD